MKATIDTRATTNVPPTAIPTITSALRDEASSLLFCFGNADGTAAQEGDREGVMKLEGVTDGVGSAEPVMTEAGTGEG
jgi:cysteine sulfinate desulfinase/cysteine desulfurase-like protein